MSLSGSMLYRPSLASVQPESQGGSGDETASAHTHTQSAVSPSVSGFSSALNTNQWENIINNVLIIWSKASFGSAFV